MYRSVDIQIHKLITSYSANTVPLQKNALTSGGLPVTFYQLRLPMHLVSFPHGRSPVPVFFGKAFIGSLSVKVISFVTFRGHHSISCERRKDLTNGSVEHRQNTKAFLFQENLLKTMLQIENTFFALGESCSRDCLIICDRGAMDASACKVLSSHFIMHACQEQAAVNVEEAKKNHKDLMKKQLLLLKPMELWKDALSQMLYAVIRLNGKFVIYKKYEIQAPTSELNLFTVRKLGGVLVNKLENGLKSIPAMPKDSYSYSRWKGRNDKILGFIKYIHNYYY
ncbi:hypothetical protein C0J52_24500 [Blattella germanica]|nr:hypothetical protein C0J52_24500 [Blattella germanica]